MPEFSPRDVRDLIGARSVLRYLSLARMDEQHAEIDALQARFKSTRVVHAVTDSLVRDEWSELAMSGRAIRFHFNQAPVAAQQSLLEIGNGVSAGLPTGKVLGIKKIVVLNNTAVATLFGVVIDAAYLGATLVSPGQIRYPNSGVLGSFPAYLVGGNSGANCRAGSAVNAAVSGQQVAIYQAPPNEQVVIEVPGGWYQLLMDALSAGNPNVIRIFNLTVNQQAVFTVECAELPIDYF